MPGQHHDRPRSGGYRAEMPDIRTNFRFDANYLKDGYFSDDQCEKVRDEVLGSLALDVAKALANANVKPHHLRQCFDRVRAIERDIGKQRSFDSAKADIIKLKSEVDFQAGCGLLSVDFKRFIDRNVELALQNELCFTQGFIPHFAAVLESFAYLTRPRAYRSASSAESSGKIPRAEEKLVPLTQRPALFAAGDVTNVFIEQVLIAVGEGAKAALSAYEYLLNQ